MLGTMSNQVATQPRLRQGPIIILDPSTIPRCGVEANTADASLCHRLSCRVVSRQRSLRSSAMPNGSLLLPHRVFFVIYDDVYLDQKKKKKKKKKKRSFFFFFFFFFFFLVKINIIIDYEKHAMRQEKRAVRHGRRP
eukprot:TRINITY_DN1327_c0_g1_i4.p3 TRINITY_DN1327_c0_g1~~TRINITY_DN1327_c0_g1_i4.p3  ORF type:complete len:137 (+),score=61.01 TRINITY_DN1327_c0_g1_i4:327-737(+)